MADDINVTFAAADEGLMAYVARLKAQFSEFDAAAVQLGGKVAAAFSKMRITLKEGFERATPEIKNALGQFVAFGEGVERVKGSVTGATNVMRDFGNRSRQTGIDFGAMAERMAARLVMLEAIRLAIQGIKYAVDQISNLQQAQIQFNAMADGLDHLSGRFEYLKKQAAEGLIPPEKAAQVVQTLQDYGASADQAQLHIKDLGQWSNILGVDADKLAEALGRVSRGEDLEGTSGRLVTHMMGEQSAAGRQLIQTIVDATKALKNFEMEQATAEKSIDAVIRATERMGEKVERSRSRGQEFLKETGNLEDIQAQLPKLAARPELAGLPIETLIGSGALRLPQMSPQTSQIVRNQVRDYVSEYRKGLAQVQQEEGLSPEAMRKLAPTLSTDYIMGKAKEAHQDEMRNIREEDADRRASIERQKTARELGIAGAKAEFARVGPQAVTTPPADLLAQLAGSIKGTADQAKTMLDAKISDVVKAIGDAVTKLNAIQTADETTAAMLSGGT